MASVNIAIELMGALTGLTLFISLFASGDMKTREGRLFAVIPATLALTLLCDATSWALSGHAVPWLNFTARATNFLAYSLGVFVHLWLVRYLMACVTRRDKGSRLLIGITAACCCALEVLVILSELFGFAYYIEEGVFYLGEMYWLYALLYILLLVYVIGIVIHYRHALKRQSATAFLAFSALLLLGNIAEMIFPDLMLSYGAAMLGTLIIYVNVQVKKGRQMEAEMADSRVAIMLSQIQPHFLYNALVAIEHLCDTDAAGAREAVGAFSAYLRGNLDSLSIRRPILFSKELEHVRTYLSLEERRFGKRLRIVYEIEEKDFLLPALTLQTIVENAVQHGVTQRPQGGTVTIRTQAQPRHWCITVIDDGVGFAPGAPAMDGQQHVGLQNVRSRLEAMCGGQIDVHSVPGEGTVVNLYIPKGGN